MPSDIAISNLPASGVVASGNVLPIVQAGVTVKAQVAGLVAGLPEATVSAAGTMPAGDKAKLNAATSSNTSSTLVQRDASGNFSAGVITASRITGLSAPTTGSDATTKTYVDSVGLLPADKTKLDNATSSNTPSTLVQRDASGNFAAGVITANSVTGLTAPVNASDAANKGYVDAAAAGLTIKTSVKAATSGSNITLSGGAPTTLDGVSLALNDRILVKDQSDQTQNGIYYVATLGTGSNGTWSRTSDADTGAKLITGSYVFVNSGTANASSGWVMTTTGTITIGVSNIVWTLFSQVTSVPAANITGQLVSAQIADSSINTAKFASGITPVEIVSTLPTSGNFSGRTVFLTTDGQLYRYSGGAWTTAVPTTSLVGTVTSAQIANSAITTAKFASGLTPIEIVSTLPSSGNFAGREVFLTTDSKLYRYTGTAWTASVATVDLTGQITNSQIVDAAIDSVKIATSAITTTKIADNAITTPKIVAGAVQAAQIDALAVTAGKIATNAVTASTIAAGAVEAGKLAANAVTAGTIAANAVTAGTVAAGAITATEIASGAITTSKIYAGAVDANALAANSIVAGKIATDAVTAGTIAANAVTAGKLAANAVTAGTIAAAAVSATEIASGAITTDKIYAGAVDANALAANSVTAGKIVAGTITSAQIAAGTITATNIAAGTITADRIAIATISGSNIAGTTITGANIATGTITAANIAAGTITADKITSRTITGTQIALTTITGGNIETGTITADRLNVTSLSAITANLGTVTAGSLTASSSVSVGSGTSAVNISSTGLTIASGRISFVGDGANPRMMCYGSGGYASDYVMINGYNSGVVPPYIQCVTGSNNTGMSGNAIALGFTANILMGPYCRIQKNPSDTWTPQLFDGTHVLEFRWDGSDLQVRIDGTTVKTITTT